MDTHGYCVRVDALDGYRDKLPLLSACQDYKSIIAVKHNGISKENPHYHLVVRTDVQSQAFRVRMRKIFDQGKGNGHMSIKPWDGSNDAVSYLFHEDDTAEVIVRHNISDETIARARERNKQVQQLIQASKDKASWKLEDISYQYFSTQWKPTEYGSKRPSESTIGQHLIITALRSGKYVPQPWHIRAMTQRIMYALLNGDLEAEEEFAMRLAMNIFNP